MNDNHDSTVSWEPVRDYLLKHVPGWFASTPEEALTLQLDDDEWLLEVTPVGLLVCQAGYMLEDMESILSDGTAEDLGSDELAKQAKFYLQQTVSKHRRRLLNDGFAERIEMNDEFVAIFFEQPVEFGDLPALVSSIQEARSRFSISSS